MTSIGFNWYEYLDLAYEIAGAPTVPTTAEAHARAAISRAYYAAHKTALHQAITRGHYQPPPRGTVGVHIDLILHIKNGPTVHHYRVGTNLDILRRLRTQMDYEEQINPVEIRRVVQRLDYARRLIADLRRLPAW